MELAGFQKLRANEKAFGAAQLRTYYFKVKLKAQLGCLQNKHFFLFWFEPKQTETQFISVLLWSFSRNKKNSVCFGVLEPFRNELKQKFGITKQTKTIMYWTWTWTWMWMQTWKLKV